jgi:hypothetical protein
MVFGGEARSETDDRADMSAPELMKCVHGADGAGLPVGALVRWLGCAQWISGSGPKWGGLWPR